ncbi:mammaglobin-A-like [Equus asinus]|uniref:Mammaglobin-A-like n=1 Tax=Equus asinus TaxID=9793 RepID=A0A8C4PL20_EQUAS|nr:mammaglobin-A-like [Equus asinus]XP_046500390.1 mammaglobin-A-like [Equus quagga]
MKLVTVLMLAAFPLYCYAGSGCSVYEDLVDQTIDPTQSPAEYVAAFQEFITDNATAKAAMELKQCYLNQSNETLANFDQMMQAIFESVWCAAF